LKIESELALPGALELGRYGDSKHSPIHWNDSGDLRIVNKVPGGTVNPGKVVAGLARAAQSTGAQLVEHAEVIGIESAYPSKAEHPRRLRLTFRSGPNEKSTKTVFGDRVLLATNAFSLDLNDLPAAEPKLTMALATAPLTKKQLRALGLHGNKPFYTSDLPYLWGRLMKNGVAIFGSGLVHAPVERDLQKIDIRKGDALERLNWLEARVRGLHPVLQNVRITHRWGGPILFTEGQKPIFRAHPRLPHVTILAGYNGHGVALSVYLGRWAAQALLGRRQLPDW